MADPIVYLSDWMRRARAVHGSRNFANITVSADLYDAIIKQVGGVVLQVANTEGPAADVIRGPYRPGSAWTVLAYNLRPRNTEPYTEPVFDVDMD